jgi:hypothetical protein
MNKESSDCSTVPGESLMIDISTVQAKTSKHNGQFCITKVLWKGSHVLKHL